LRQRRRPKNQQRPGTDRFDVNRNKKHLQENRARKRGLAGIGCSIANEKAKPIFS
jgi:hypothetical protein